MNRTAHVAQSAHAVARLDFHHQHVILDYGSSPPVQRDELPADPRVQLLRAEAPTGRWWLTHSYNLAFATAHGDYILKLDADVVPSQSFIDGLQECLATSHADLMCNRLTLQDWSLPHEMFTTNGLFLCKREKLEQLKGFNPYIQGWGWDEIDLYSRFFLAGFLISRIPQQGVEPIAHGDDLREQPIRQNPASDAFFWRSRLREVDASRRLEAQNEKNKRVAIASLVRGIDWPNFRDYADSYARTGHLPALPNVALFSRKDRQALAAALTRKLLQPNRMKHVAWRLMQRVDRGPYSDRGTTEILEACNIDLGLVS